MILSLQELDQVDPIDFSCVSIKGILQSTHNYHLFVTKEEGCMNCNAS